MKRIIIGLMLAFAFSAEAADDWSAIPCPEAIGANGSSLTDGWYVDAAVLWWKVGGDELDYGLVRYEYDNGNSTSFVQRYHDVRMGTDIGFRLGFGMPVPCYNWSLEGNWTHFKNHTTSRKVDSADSQAAETIFAIPYISGSEIDEPLGSTNVAKFSGHYSLRYDVVDIECGKWLGRRCSSFGFRPHAGIRMANIREKLRSRLATTSAQDYVYEGNVTNDFIGLGLRAGFDASLALYQGLSLIGKASGSIVWGRTKINLQADGTSDNLSLADIQARSKEDYLQGRAMADLALGLNYITEICCCPLDIELDWELRYLFGQHRFFTNNAFAGFGSSYPSLQTKKNGDLTLQGLTLKFAFDF